MIIEKSLLPNTKKEQILSYHSIFTKLKNSISKESNHIVVIEFGDDEKIKFVHPLFLI